MPTNNSNSKAAAKKPTHIAYHVRENGNGDGFWTRIGAAWPHSDGQGFNIQLDSLMPLDGRITLRIAAEQAAQ